MGIRYEKDPALQEKVSEIATILFPHVRMDSVVCLRSYGSSSRGTIARCHALGKAMQLALGRKGFYVIEVISKRFDRMSEADKIRTLIHELMHIPKSFGGGFIHHDVVHERNVEKEFMRYIHIKKQNSNVDLTHYLSVPATYKRELTPGQIIEREFFVIPEKKERVPEKKRGWFFS